MVWLLETAISWAGTAIAGYVGSQAGNAAWELFRPYWDKVIDRLTPSDKEMEELCEAVREAEEMSSNNK